MFLSRIWVLLVTVFAILATVAFLLAGRPAEYRLTEFLEKQLDVAQGLVDMHLRSEARRRLDLLSAMGKDPKIVRPLMAMESPKAPQDAASKLKKGLEQAVRKLGFRVSVVAVTNRAGKVLARVGAGGQVGDSLAGLPEVQAALRGKCLDNTQLRGSTLYWVYVCPVRYAKIGDKVRLLGAVRAEVPVDKEFVAELLALIGQEASKDSQSKKLKVELCFFVANQPVGCTKPSELWRKYAPKIFAKYKKEVLDPAVARSPVVSVSEGGTRYLMIVGLLRGAASQGQNYWAMLWRFPGGTGRFAFLSGKVPRSYLLEGFPWVAVILCSILALAFGVFVIIWEADRPLSRLLSEARKVAAGEKEKVDETRFKGRFGLLAIAINEAVEHALESGGQHSLHKKNLDAILGELEPQAAPPDAYEPPPPSAVAKGASPPPPPVRGPSDSGGLSAGISSDGIRPMTVHKGTPAAASGMEFQTQDSDLGPNVEAHFKQVYAQFVETKKQCGEDVSNLSYEAFRSKLVQNRQKIMASRKCRDVHFKVYVKNGKAALKATPVD